MLKQITLYRTNLGVEPYADYVDTLKDSAGAAKIRIRVRRAGLGNFGDYRSVGGGVIELRIHEGPGYRVYIGLLGQEVIVLLCAGSKSTQDKDIANALNYWADYKRTI